MQIHLKQPDQPVADFSIAGTVVTVGGMEVDCAFRQEDAMATVEIRSSGAGPSEAGQGAYLAQIEIPARQYIEIPGATEEDQMTREAVPLDPHAISVTLWPTA